MDSLSRTPISPYSPGEKLPCTHNENCPHDPPKMPGHRHRDKDGSLRKTSGAKHLGTLEDDLGEFSRLNDQTHLSELRERTGKVGVNAVKAQIKKQESVCKVNSVA